LRPGRGGAACSALRRCRRARRAPGEPAIAPSVGRRSADGDRRGAPLGGPLSAAAAGRSEEGVSGREAGAPRADAAAAAVAADAAGATAARVGVRVLPGAAAAAAGSGRERAATDARRRGSGD